MRDFITGLQFLTTIRLWPETEWSDKRFGRSVRYFPIVGAVIGIVLAGMQSLLSHWLPTHVMAALLIVGGIIITGGLHCDGFMDTMDGVFSGRSKDRMLEIMKDSRVGANGVMAFACLLILKWSILLDIPATALASGLFVTPIAGRMAMVFAITSFPYARPHGIGKAFAEYASGWTLALALGSAMILIAPMGWKLAAACVLGIALGCLFARFVNIRLGGLTGDVYGAVTEITEISVLFAMMLILKFI